MALTQTHLVLALLLLRCSASPPVLQLYASWAQLLLPIPSGPTEVVLLKLLLLLLLLVPLLLQELLLSRRKSAPADSSAPSGELLLLLLLVLLLLQLLLRPLRATAPESPSAPPPSPSLLQRPLPALALDGVLQRVGVAGGWRCEPPSVLPPVPAVALLFALLSSSTSWCVRSQSLPLQG